MITGFGVIWVIIGLVAFVRGGRYLLGTLVLASVFQAAAVFNISLGNHSIPLIPFYWIAVITVVRITLEVLSGRVSLRLPANLRVALWLFVVFTTYSFISSLLLPYLFEGMPIYDPRKGIDSQFHNLSYLHPGFSSIGQSIYLIINFLCFLFILEQAPKNGSKEIFARVVTISGVVVITITIWQFLAKTFGAPFPNTWFYSAEGRSLGYEQTIGGFARLNGPFTEPSNLASFMVAYLAFLWRMWVDYKSKNLGLLIAISLIVLLSTTSTTAYIGIVGIIGFALICYGLFPFLSIKGALSRRMLVVGGIVFILLAISVFIALAIEPMTIIMERALLEKASSNSLTHRIAADWHALRIVVETYGLGVGLGANRPSSFATWLLSNVGIFGSMFFFIFLCVLTYAGLASSRYTESARDRGIAAAAAWGLWAHLGTKLISQPDLSFAPIWIWIGFLGTVIVANRMHSRRHLVVHSNYTPIRVLQSNLEV